MNIEQFVPMMLGQEPLPVRQGDVINIPTRLPVEWLADTPTHHPSLAEIVEATAIEHGLTAALITSERRARRFTKPRHQAIFLAADLTPYSLPRIGRHFERDHTTVMHAITRVKDMLDADDARCIADLAAIQNTLARLRSQRHA